METSFKVSKKFITKLEQIIDHGLVKGLGNPKEGELCIEAAICLAKGAPHSDEPTCVHYALRSFSIALNDARWSSNAARAAGLKRLAIAQLGTNTVQFDAKHFATQMALYAVRVTVPFALRTAAAVHPDQKHKDALEEHAKKCEAVPDAADAADAAAAAAAARYAADAARYAVDAADAADAAAAAAAARYAADAARYAAAAAAAAARYAAAAAADAARYAAADAAADKPLIETAEYAVQLLIAMKTPGAKFLKAGAKCQ